MNWEAIGAVGEILGALAVVATLGYLATQIRQNTKTARSSMRQAIAEMTMSTARDIVSHGELAEAFAKQMAGEALSQPERLRLIARCYVAMRNYENIHYQYLSGMLSDDEWQGFRLNLKAIIQWDTMQTYWKNEHQYYSKAFQELIAAVQREIEEQSTDDHDYLRRGDY